MNKYSLTHLSDQTLLRDLAALVSRDRVTTAELLAHIAEVDARKLYLPAACPSMYVYCVRVLGLSEEAAFKRIHAARAAQQFPAIFAALADGRLHLSAVVILAPHLTRETVDELLAAAANKSKSQVEEFLARRHPRPEVPTQLHSLSPQVSDAQVSVETTQHAPGRVEALIPRAKLAPLSSDRYELQLTVSRSTRDKLRYAEELLSHQVRPGDIAEVLDRALDALISRLEKNKFAATSRPRKGPRRSTTEQHAPGRVDGRHVPAEVKRAVWARDGGQCTFVSETGQRCPSRTQIEFDHVDPVARGGQASVARMRLRCRAHNQYEAERAFGVGFMREKREQARSVATAQSPGADQDPERDVTPWLRALGFRADQARRAAEACESLVEASLEARVRYALAFLAPPHRKDTSHLGSTG